MLTSFLNKNFKLVLFLSILLIFFYKSPYILLNGRFVAEEGDFFFRNAYLFGPIKGLTQVFWGSSYFNLWPNISAVLSTLVPLEYSPLVSVYCAAILQIYLFIFIIFSKSSFIISNFDKTIISLVVLASPPMVAEVWLNNLGAQVYFTILTVLIFFQKDISKNIFNKLSPIILFLSGMTSLLPCILSPFFLFKYLKKKSKYNLINFIVISSVTVFQSVIFIYSRVQHLHLMGENTRFMISFDKLINYIYNVPVKSFLGRDLTQFIYNYFLSSTNIFLLACLIILISMIIFIYSLLKFKNDKIFPYLLIFFLLLSMVAFFGSKVEQVQGRFALVPGILLIFITYRIFQISSHKIRIFSLILVVISLTAGFYEYKSRNIYPQFLTCIDCPNWKNEVKKWKNDNSYRLKIWQYPVKEMSLEIK